METGIIFNINELTLYEGTGLNIAVFMKGCYLKCKWCHNPESMEPSIQTYGNKQIGEKLTSKMLANLLNKYAQLQKKLGGYIIFSGGEPLLQVDFLIEVIQQLEYKKIAIDTSGFVNQACFEKISPFVSRYYYDLKIADRAKHIFYTGENNQKIIENLHFIDHNNNEIIIRIPLIKGIIATDENLLGISQIVHECSNIKGIELLEENPYTESKYRMLDIKYSLVNRDMHEFTMNKNIWGDVPVEFWRLSDE